MTTPEISYGFFLDQLDPAEDYFAVAQGLYWFCADYHDGQWSQLYSILSSLDYHPAPTERGPEPGTLAETIYEALAAVDIDVGNTWTFVEDGLDAAG